MEMSHCLVHTNSPCDGPSYFSLFFLIYICTEVQKHLTYFLSNRKLTDFEEISFVDKGLIWKTFLDANYFSFFLITAQFSEI